MIDLQVNKSQGIAKLRNNGELVIEFDIPTTDGYYSIAHDKTITAVTAAVASTLDTLIVYVQSGDITVVKSPVAVSVYQEQTYSYTPILEGTATASQSIHGASGTTTTVAWDATTNVSTEVDSFTNGGNSISLLNSGEVCIHASVFTEQGVNNRTTYSLSLVHKNSSDTVLRTYHMDSMYIRDDNNTYDSGLMGFDKRLHVSAGDKLEIVTEVLDTQTTAGTVNLGTTRSQIFIDKVQYW